MMTPSVIPLLPELGHELEMNTPHSSVDVEALATYSKDSLLSLSDQHVVCSLSKAISGIWRWEGQLNTQLFQSQGLNDLQSFSPIWNAVKKTRDIARIQRAITS